MEFKGMPEMKVEGESRFGENVILRLVFSRHGEKEYDPKTPNSGLTPRGEEESHAFGRTRGVRDMVKVYVSDTERTEKTGEKVLEGSPTETKGKLRKRGELFFSYEEKGKFISEALRIKKDAMEGNPVPLSESEKQERMREATEKQIDYYLSFGSEKPDPGTYSPVEASSGIAKLIEWYIKMSKRLKSGSDVDLIHVTHDLNLSAFLKEGRFRSGESESFEGFGTTEKMGGPIDFNDSFEVIVRRKNAEKVSVSFLFRDKEYELDMSRIRELSAVFDSMSNP